MPLSGEAIRMMNYIDDISTTLRRILALSPTLSADEREQAEAMLLVDPGFAEIVRVWERRLGELNVHHPRRAEPLGGGCDGYRSRSGKASWRGHVFSSSLSEVIVRCTVAFDRR